MAEKIYKPKSCEDCPVFRRKECKCGCQPSFSGRGQPKPNQKPTTYEMWKTCPIDWDKPEKEKKNADTTRK